MNKTLPSVRQEQDISAAEFIQVGFFFFMHNLEYSTVSIKCSSSTPPHFFFVKIEIRTGWPCSVSKQFYVMLFNQTFSVSSQVSRY